MWGGKQEKPRSSQILEEESFLGPPSPNLKVGDVQQMIYSETDEGPYYLKDIVREAHRDNEKTAEIRLKESIGTAGSQ
jgi:hypothetical protein